MIKLDSVKLGEVPGADQRRRVIDGCPTLLSPPDIEAFTKHIVSPSYPRAWDTVHGGVYFASNSQGWIKIGHGVNPAWRVMSQNLSAMVFVLGCSVRHEKAVHEFLHPERADSGEYFRGPLTLELIGLLRSRADRVLSDCKYDDFHPTAKRTVAA